MSENMTEAPQDASPLIPATPAITQVHYQKVCNLGNYENERIGAWGPVAPGQDPAEALSLLKGWVDRQAQLRQEAAALEEQISVLKMDKRDLEDSVKRARDQYIKAKMFVEGLGLSMPSGYARADDMPW